ncbi:hypothetical protein [Cupriavidus sp. 2SB]|uniref:hypothetical protein n=1 Tax=unclassified Cupriavidus TaxID=2640874 RepID=UPI0010F8D729|nr:hypothetical protein [Cupriavidus sp. 2SB]
MDYTPISCEFHDRLEDVATLRKQAVIRYRDANGDIQQCTARIADIVNLKKEEFLLLDSGESIRLDRLVEVDGYLLADAG